MANGIEFWSSSGHEYRTGEYLFRSDLTVDTLIKIRRERGFYDGRRTG